MSNRAAGVVVSAALVVAFASTPWRAVVADEALAGSPNDVTATVASEGAKVPPPTGHATKFILPFYRSVEGDGTTPNSSTSLQISNLNNATCEVSVQWLKQDALACELTVTLGPYMTGILCTRDISGPGSALDSCLVTCSPALTFQQGRAQVNIEKLTTCKKFALAARLIQSDSTDTALIAMQDLKIVKPTGNVGE
jgi:hypothetical protein